TIAAIRREAGSDLIIQVTSEAAKRFTPRQQMAAIQELRPEAVSIAIREILETGDGRVPDLTDSDRARFFAWLGRERVSPQYILYDAEDLRTLAEACRKGIIPDDSLFL